MLNVTDFIHSTDYKAKHLRTLSFLRAVCQEKDVKVSSLRQACHDLKIELSCDGDRIDVSIPPTLLEGEYIARGHLEKEILSFTPEIQNILGKEDESPLSTDGTTQGLSQAIKQPEIAQIADIGSIPPNESEITEIRRLPSNAIERTLFPQDISIIQSYRSHLHDLLKSLVHIRDGKNACFSLTQQDLENFRHNMRWFFVSIEYYIEGWHPADVRTLWSDGWREQNIIPFLASKPVKYIMCHNDKIIQCLDLENKVYVFEKKRRL